MSGYEVVAIVLLFFFFFQAEDGIRDVAVTGVQTCALPISGDLGDASADLAACLCRSRGERAVGRSGIHGDESGNFSSVRSGQGDRDDHRARQGGSIGNKVWRAGKFFLVCRGYSREGDGQGTSRGPG